MIKTTIFTILTTLATAQLLTSAPSDSGIVMCIRSCPNVFRAVCGDDKVTYQSYCHLNCNPGVEFAYLGACVDYNAGTGPVVQPPQQNTSTGNTNNTLTTNCVCSDDYFPVCGSDGLTYANDCRAGCVGAAVVSRGVCPNAACTCNTAYSPVCGIDGNTYSSACAAGCVNIAIAYQGTCYNCEAGCPTYISYVCGQDGLTYRNDCQLTCSKKTTLAGFGICAAKASCSCPSVSSGHVCGVNRRLYASECAANCDGMSIIPLSNCQ